MLKVLEEKGRDLRATLTEKWRRRGDERSEDEEMELEEEPRQLSAYLQNIRVEHRDRTLSVGMWKVYISIF